jgi:RND family efflux transporter MFP subunit
MKATWLAIPVVFLAACGREPAPPPKHGAAKAVPVTAAAVSFENRPETYEATGTVRARTAAALASKFMGYVQQVSVQVGDTVREGQVLVTLDARDLDANLRRAEAASAETRSAAPEADNGIAAAKANLELAQATFRRIDELASKRSVSAQELDEASARLKAAEASYQMAEARRKQLQSKIEQAEQEQGAARINRGYATITAPFAGVVTNKAVEPGNLAAPGIALLTVERAGAYWLEAEVDESKVKAVRPGMTARVTLDALERSFEARVSEVMPVVDAVSRAYTVKIELPAVAGLRSGMFGKAAFSLGQRQALAVPASAVQERGQLQSVFVVTNGEARTRLITTGRRLGSSIEVISGLAVGESVVLAPPPSLADGDCVEVRQ